MKPKVLGIITLAALATAAVSGIAYARAKKKSSSRA